MLITVFILSCTHCFYIKSYILTMFSVSVLFQDFYLIECLTEVFNTKCFILARYTARYYEKYRA